MTRRRRRSRAARARTGAARTLARPDGGRRAPRVRAGPTRARRRRLAGRRLAALRVGGAYRYRFTATGDGARAHPLVRLPRRAAGAPAEPGGRGTAGVVPGSTRCSTTASVAWRVRFALPLAPGEHVTGFGERFDALDHRGTELDSVVFEQYKSQGAERKTYLPMPFAHVVGGDGWGFHVRTSRRVWFDVGAADADRLWIEAETGADGALDARAASTARPREVLDAVPRPRSAGRRSCPPGCSGCGPAATSGTRRPRSCGRWTRTASTTSRSARS